MQHRSIVRLADVTRRAVADVGVAVAFHDAPPVAVVAAFRMRKKDRSPLRA